MSQINPDPHTKGYAYYPIHSVTGFFEPGQDVQPILAELSAAGFSEDAVQAFVGSEGLEKLDPEGRFHGWWVRMIRDIGDTFLDDQQEFWRAEQILKAGGSVIAVATHKDEEKKRSAAKILRAHQGQDVMYWGQLLREYFVERESGLPSEFKAALELELQNKMQSAANCRQHAAQAGSLGLNKLQAELEEIAEVDEKHVSTLRWILSEV